MAATKFGTMLRRNTNTVVVALVYAVLEWVLILLLLLNSLFSYAITRFAKWVGLKPPCPFCSRLDHVVEPGDKSKVLQSDLICETHAVEISKMGFCSNHRKMAETQSMCEDCLASCPNHHDMNSIRRIAFVSWLSHDKAEKTERCSCCNKGLSPPYLLLESSWGDENYTSKGTLIVEALDNDDDEEEEEGGDEDCEHQILSDIESFILREVAEDRSSSVSKDAEKDEKEDDLLIDCCSESVWEDRSLEVINMHFENSVACDDNNLRVIPVELIDSFTSAKFEPSRDQKIETFATESSMEADENSGVLEVEELKQGSEYEVQEKLDNAQEFECSQEDQSSTSDDDAEVQNSCDEFSVQNNLCMSQSLSYDGHNIEAALEEADNTRANAAQSEEPNCSFCQCIEEEEEEEEEEDQSSTSIDDAEVLNAFDEFIAQNNLCPVQTGANDNECAETILVEENREETSHHQSLKFYEADEVEEDKLPETPSTMDGLHYLHSKLMLLEKTESGVAEDSEDGSETESDYPVSTIERLKTALKAERKALSALYQELEEERSASAISANQTMAMITRLQEEKASMQMEALQYQRMMEEQSEYDQEALQLLNDLMVKKDKEKQELEKELEEYKQKVMDYEAKEKLRVLRRMKNGSIKGRESSSCPSLLSDTEELSIDLDCEAREEDNNNATTTATANTVSSLEEITLDCVKHMSELDTSLAEFEEEKMSILDQLKALEEKIITLGDNEQLLDDFNENCIFSSPEEEMFPNNEFSDDKQCYSPRRPMGSLAKRLLPYLDAAVDNETEETYSCERQMENSGPTDSTMEVSIEEEVGHVYERLQALETDTDFLRHCMGSVQKGDKGMDLLQEILQHFRDLKVVELQLKDLGDDDPSR